MICVHTLNTHITVGNYDLDRKGAKRMKMHLGKFESIAQEMFTISMHLDREKRIEEDKPRIYYAERSAGMEQLRDLTELVEEIASEIEKDGACSRAPRDIRRTRRSEGRTPPWYHVSINDEAVIFRTESPWAFTLVDKIK